MIHRATQSRRQQPVLAIIKYRKFLVAVWLLASIPPGQANSAEAPDIDKGKAIAGRWCASCHLVAPDQKQTSADVPSFASIAARPNFSSKAIATFLLDPHPKMPSFALTRQETNDIAEYIASLAGKQRKPTPPPITKDFTL